MTRAKMIAGVIFSASLALLAIWIGAQSLGEVFAPQSAFTLLTEIPISTSTPTVTPDYFAESAKPKKVQPKPEPIVIPATAVAAVVVAPPVSLQPPVIVTPEPQPVPVPVVPPAPDPQPTAPMPAQPVSMTVNILISEVFVGAETSGEDEFIELYNAGQQSVDLTGWSINKKTASGKEDNLVAKARLQGKVIIPSQHFLLVHDSSSFGGAAPDALWAKSNTIAAKNNTIILYNAAGIKVDEANWPEIPKGSSYARLLLMEGGQFSVQNTPTPKQ